MTTHQQPTRIEDPMSTDPTALSGFAAIPVADVHPSPNNPRENLNGIEELGISIRENGLIQPLIVQRHPDRPGFQLIAGHRRHEAVRRLGWPTVPCIIRRDLRPDEELLAMLVENGQRAGLDPIEEARALRKLKAQGMSDLDIARKVGRSQTHVSSRLSMLALPIEEQEELRAGQMTVSEASAKGRLASGRVRPGAIGKRGPNYLGAHHDLAVKAKARCLRLKHSRGKGAGVGGIACGECWESVIRADERQHLHDVSEQRGRCVLCDTATPPPPDDEPEAADTAVDDDQDAQDDAADDGRPFDEAVVVRRLNGDHTARMRKADRFEIVRRAQARGLSYLDIERLTGINKVERYITRDEPRVDVAS